MNRRLYACDWCETVIARKPELDNGCRKPCPSCERTDWIKVDIDG